MMKYVEKRKYNRINTRVTAQVSNNSAIVLDLSKNGIKLSTEILSRKLFDLIDIVLKMGNQTITVKGMIRWISKKSELSNYRMIGVLIKNASENFPQLISQLEKKLQWHKKPEVNYFYIWGIVFIALALLFLTLLT